MWRGLNWDRSSRQSFAYSCAVKRRSRCTHKNGRNILTRHRHTCTSPFCKRPFLGRYSLATVAGNRFVGAPVWHPWARLSKAEKHASLFSGTFPVYHLSGRCFWLADSGVLFETGFQIRAMVEPLFYKNRPRKSTHKVEASLLDQLSYELSSGTTADSERMDR